MAIADLSRLHGNHAPSGAGIKQLSAPLNGWQLPLPGNCCGIENRMRIVGEWHAQDRRAVRDAG